MKTVLNAKLRKNHLSCDPLDYNAQVVVNGNLGIVEVIDELLKENVDMNREQILNIMTAFNRKASELVVSGFNVNTGLVILSPIIKGPFYEKKWNSNINSVDVSFKPGYALNKALNDTDIQILEEHGEVFESINQSTESSSINENQSNNDSWLLNSTQEPACGMAFRRWLCNS